MAEDSLTLPKLFHGSAKVLNALFEETRVLTHRGMKGERREVIFRNFLRRWLPTQFAVGHGLVVRADGSVSNELDCIVYDPTVAPALYCFDPRVVEEYRVFAIETVVALFAVKSVLDSKDTLREACENLDSAASLKPSPTPFHVEPTGIHVVHGTRGSFRRPYSAVIAYASDIADGTIKQWLNEELQAGSALPDAVWVPGKTLIVRFEPGQKPVYRGLLVRPERAQCFAAIVGDKEDYGLPVLHSLRLSDQGRAQSAKHSCVSSQPTELRDCYIGSGQPLPRGRDFDTPPKLCYPRSARGRGERSRRR